MACWNCARIVLVDELVLERGKMKDIFIYTRDIKYKLLKLLER